MKRRPDFEANIIAAGESTPIPEPPLTVTAQQLARAYRENEIAADDRYEDRAVIVSGVIDDITRGPDGMYGVKYGAAGGCFA